MSVGDAPVLRATAAKGDMPDNTTATFGQGAAATNVAASQLAFANVNAISPFVACHFAGVSFAAPPTIANAGLTQFATPFGFIARVA